MRKEAVAVILYNKETHKVLSEERTREDRTYFQHRIFPGGLVDDEDENKSVTGIREIKEELNVLVTKITKLNSDKEIVGDYGEIIYPYFADEWQGKIPEQTQDNNSLIWESIDEVLASDLSFRVQIMQLVIQHLMTEDLRDETEAIEAQSS